MNPAFSTYMNDIERFFCVVRMSGFILSPRDYERVRQWYMKGIPLQVVLNGIVEGARSHRYRAGPSDRLPHQLSFYSHFIGAKVRSFRTEEEPEEDQAADDTLELLQHLYSELELLILKEERSLERKVKAECLERLQSLEEEVKQGLAQQEFLHRLQLLDEKTVALYHSLLDEDRVCAIATEIDRELAQERGMGGKALEGRRKVLLAGALREQLNMVALGI